MQNKVYRSAECGMVVRMTPSAVPGTPEEEPCQSLPGRRYERTGCAGRPSVRALSFLKRRRDPHAIDFGTYMLVDPNRCALVPADHNRGCGLDLDGVETWLTESAEQ